MEKNIYNLVKGLVGSIEKENSINGGGKGATLRQKYPPISISRELGSGGRIVAQAIAKKIDYKIFDKELMEVIAREEKISSDLIKTLDEGKASSIEIWVESLLKGEALDEYDYITKLTKVINSLADAGKGIFLGRASHIILASGSGIRVRIVDKFENRIKNMRRYDNIDETAAVKILKESDKDRAKFLKTYFNSDINNPLQYDLVINCSGFDSVDDIADIIICSLKKAKIKMSGVTK